MRWGGYLVASAAVLPWPAFAQEAQSTIAPLWRDIVPGDSPEAVATKLQSLPEIKAVKVIANADPAKTKIKISYNGEGIDVFGEKFKLAVIFDNQGVTRIGLAEYGTCAHDLYDRYERIYDALAAKYPDSPLPEPKLSKAKFAEARSRTTEATPQSLASILYNDNVGVVFKIDLSRYDAPAGGYQNGKLAQALQNYAWSAHERKVQECSGTGDYRAGLMIAYTTRAEFDKLSDQTKRTLEQRAQDANSKL